MMKTEITAVKRPSAPWAAERQIALQGEKLVQDQNQEH
jgi:hypothetical protein